MISKLIHLARIRRNEQGSVVIETAFILPILVMLCLGGFEVSRLVSRNNELQVAVAEAAAIALAKLPETQDDIDDLEDIIEASTGLDDANVTLTRKFRCNIDDELTSNDSCDDASAVISEFVEITVTDWYSPIWTDFGVGSTVNYDFTRRVQIS